MQPMATLTTSKAAKIEGTFTPPGDKSISHRAIMLSAIGNGKARFTNFLNGEDCLSTVKAFQAMGVPIKFHSPTDVEVIGVGKRGLKKPAHALDMGNSGTTTRLLMGILAGQNFSAELKGDASLSSRPMKRIVEPLTLMGAKFSGQNNAEKLPLTVHGAGKLKAMTHKLKIASAQLKSALLLAGLYANGETTVIEPNLSRDHTELMMQYFGVDLKGDETGLRVSINGNAELTLQDLSIPGDISSAAFFMVAAALFIGSDVKIKNVGFNPTRRGIWDILLKMGANIEIPFLSPITLNRDQFVEMRIRGAKLKGTEISGQIIPWLIDEIPILAVAGALAHGTTTIRNAEELRVKETDRIKAMVQHLRTLGTKVEELPDGMVIEGPTKFKGGRFSSFGDHRIAMSLAIAGLFSEKPVTIEDTACIQTSFPEFESILNSLVRHA